MTALLMLGLVAAAVTVGCWRPRRSRGRLAAVAGRPPGALTGSPAPPGPPSRTGTGRPGSSRPDRSAGDASHAGRRRRSLDRPRLLALLAGAAVALVLAEWYGLVVGLAVAVAADQILRRLEPAEVRARRRAEAAELPLAADLLAVTLRGGAPVDQAAAAVAAALPGPLGERLAQVARLLALGAGAQRAWQRLAPVPGAARLLRAAVRSAEHGSALADTCSRLADDLRADRTIAADAAARRAGVLIVLPLGVCFLPAFMLAGLVPVIIAVLGDAL